MRSSTLSTVVLTIFLFLNSPALAADLCLTPDVLEGFARAKLVFSGKILNVIPVQDSQSPTASDYVVNFEVEKWWKSTGPEQLSVMWRHQCAGVLISRWVRLAKTTWFMLIRWPPPQFGSQRLAEVYVSRN